MSGRDVVYDRTVKNRVWGLIEKIMIAVSRGTKVFHEEVGFEKVEQR